MDRKQTTETHIFSFAGTDRHGHHGIHPGERISEQQELSIPVVEVRDDDGELVEVQTSAGAWKALYKQVEERARGLLELWPEQPGIRVHEDGDGEADDIWVWRDGGGEYRDDDQA